MRLTDKQTTTYAVIPAAGFIGDYATVMSTHRTLAAARKAAQPSAHVRYIVIERECRKGDKVHRADVREIE